ncbi:hypothetical protein GCM10009566_20730 [Streptomyces murinus]
MEPAVVAAAAVFGIALLVAERVGIGFGFIVAVRVGIGFLVVVTFGLGVLVAAKAPAVPPESSATDSTPAPRARP